jgi:hypothetical protein
MSTLPALVRDAVEIVQLVIKNDGELPDDLDLAKEINEAELADKVDQYGFVQDQLDVQIEFCKKKVAKWTKLLKSFESASKEMDSRLFWAMMELGVSELAGNDERFVLQNNPPHVLVQDESKIPPSYFIPPDPPVPVLDKRKILADLKQGVEVPGCMLGREMRVVRKLASAQQLKKAGGK